MKSYFIILLLFAISNCDSDDGFSFIAFYEGLEDWLKILLESLKCGFNLEIAINTCKEEKPNYPTLCEEAVKHCITCPREEREEPRTPEEKEREKKAN